MNRGRDGSTIYQAKRRNVQQWPDCQSQALVVGIPSSSSSALAHKAEAEAS
jgi:hypothetical protein